MALREIDVLGFDAHVDALCRLDPGLARIVAEHGRPRYWRRAAGLKGLVRIVLEQQVSMAAALTMFRRLDEALGGITAQRLASAGQAGLRSYGLTRQKSRYLASLGDAVRSRRLSLAAVARADDTEALRLLTALPGIGPWSASIYLMFSLGRADIWPPGDLALERVTAELIETGDVRGFRGQRWRPHRTAAAFVLWHRYLSARR